MTFNLKEQIKGVYYGSDLINWFTVNFNNLPESIETKEYTEPDIKFIVRLHLSNMNKGLKLSKGAKVPSMVKISKLCLSELYEQLKKQ